MKNILKNRKALSTVVTTLIILVVSVLLAGVVTYYAINVVSTSSQQESLNLQYAHVWYSPLYGKAEAAIMVTNTGGRDVVLQNIQVRGQTVNASNIFWFKVTTMKDLLFQEFVNSSTVVPSGYGPSGNYSKVSGSIVLPSGNTIALYMVGNPGSVSVNDVGLTIAISVFSAQATYIKETNVNAGP
jgi:flagellar basal body-associated protein FliL